MNDRTRWMSMREYWVRMLVVLIFSLLLMCAITFDGGWPQFLQITIGGLLGFIIMAVAVFGSIGRVRQ